MPLKLDELEEAVAKVLERISAQRRERPKTPAPDPALKELAEENRRFREERKDLRRRVRKIIRDIDRVRW